MQIYKGRLDAGLLAPLKLHLAPLGSDQEIVDVVGGLVADLSKAGLLAGRPEDGLCEVQTKLEHRATFRKPFTDRVYAIPDSELKVWESAAKVAAVYVGAVSPLGIGLEKAGGAILVASLGGLFTAIVAFWKKRAVLPEAQGELLIALKARPNSSVGGLIMNLPDHVTLEVERATELLEGLKAVKLENGREVALVAEQGGRWWAVDV